jgi:hypothetical protein
MGVVILPSVQLTLTNTISTAAQKDFISDAVQVTRVGPPQEFWNRYAIRVVVFQCLNQMREAFGLQFGIIVEQTNEVAVRRRSDTAVESNCSATVAEKRNPF